MPHYMPEEPVISLLIFALYGLSSAAAVLLLKLAMARGIGLANWRSAAGLLFATGATLYATSFILWLRLLSRLPLSTAYPAAIGLTLVMSLILSVVYLQERLTPVRLTGVALVFVGTFLLARTAP